MPNPGNRFRDAIAEYIISWDENLEVLKEINVGYRFINTPRKLDIVIHNKDNNKFMAIECKTQQSDGSAFEKFSYALDDCIASPMPTILVFSGSKIKDDMKSKLIMSGRGLEAIFYIDKNDKVIFEDPNGLIRQRCYIELELNWLPFATGDNIDTQLNILGYK